MKLNTHNPKKVFNYPILLKGGGNMKNLLKVTIIALFITTLFVGCATIMGKSAPESLNIRTDPTQANVVIFDEAGTKIFEGKTPTSLPLEKKRGYFSGKKYTVKITKDGYLDHSLTVDTTLNGWYIGGNLIFGGLIGWLIVDPLTGAMWTLDTNVINTTLTPLSKPGSMLDHDKIAIVLLQDVPLSLRNKMVKISD